MLCESAGCQEDDAMRTPKRAADYETRMVPNGQHELQGKHTTRKKIHEAAETMLMGYKVFETNVSLAVQ